MWKPGDWWAVCDICGFDYYASELKENWKGQRVCVKDFETRHPQEFVRTKTERISVPWSRPDSTVMDIPLTWTNGSGDTIPWRNNLNLVDAEWHNG